MPGQRARDACDGPSDTGMDYLARALDAVAAWREPAAPSHPALTPDPARFEAAWARVHASGWRRSYPFHHPRYAGQMLKPPHPVAIAAYTAAMHVNANNHALDGGPATSAMEVEVVRDLAAMFGFPADALGPPHLVAARSPTSRRCGWRASCTRARRSSTARTPTTPTRACARVLGVEALAAPADVAGRIDLDAVEALCRRATSARSSSPPGRPGTGTVDDVARAVALRERYGVRVHVDARLRRVLHAARRRSCRSRRSAAIADADSVVVDPHKHGLQPYGCGAVLFRDPGVGRLYKHDSPVHVLHERRPAPGRDPPRVLTRGRVRGRAVADAALARPRADPLRRRARRAHLGGADRATPTS